MSTLLRELVRSVSGLALVEKLNLDKTSYNNESFPNIVVLPCGLLVLKLPVKPLPSRLQEQLCHNLPHVLENFDCACQNLLLFKLTVKFASLNRSNNIFSDYIFSDYMC